MMNTCEMVVLADNNGKTYINNGVKYNKIKGFHTKKGTVSNIEYEDDFDFLNTFCHDPFWEEVKPKEMTVEDIEKILGYSIKIIGRTNEEDKN